MDKGNLNSVVADLADHFDRHLMRLAEEIEAYPDEASIWTLRAGILNSGGTLTLHLVGNLNHWVGGTLGGNGYVRDRASEFAARDVPRAELLLQIKQTRDVVTQVLPTVDVHSLDEPFPDVHQHYAGATKLWFLSHLAVHLGYHLGQVNYHRRILAAEASA